VFEDKEAMRRGDDSLNAMDPGAADRRSAVA
jgi:hypothetical protein